MDAARGSARARARGLAEIAAPAAEYVTIDGAGVDDDDSDAPPPMRYRAPDGSDARDFVVYADAACVGNGAVLETARATVL